MFEFRDVVVEAGGQTRLRGLTGIIPDHGVTVVAGPSGSGKSTLLRLCNRLEVATSGSVEFAGQPIEDTDPLQLRRQVGMVFQRPIALPGTVADNLREGAPHASDDEIRQILSRVGLDDLSERDATALSGGEAQRMCLARTLLTEPRFVLFDEPTSALDPGASTTIEELVLGLAADGVPSAWVTHDLNQMRRLAHHLVIVVDGAVAQQGDVESVLAHPAPDVARFLAGETNR